MSKSSRNCKREHFSLEQSLDDIKLAHDSELIEKKTRKQKHERLTYRRKESPFRRNV